MKKFLIRLKITFGEYEFSSKNVFTAESQEKAEELAEGRASEFYGDPGEGQSQGECYYFNHGAIAVEVHSVVELTEAEYEVLNKFLP